MGFGRVELGFGLVSDVCDRCKMVIILRISLPTNLVASFLTWVVWRRRRIVVIGHHFREWYLDLSLRWLMVELMAVVLQETLVDRVTPSPAEVRKPYRKGLKKQWRVHSRRGLRSSS